MSWVDLAILIVMLASVLGGLSQGFFRSICSLGGLFLGLAMAAWNYTRIADILAPYVRIEAVADAIGFILIAIVVMGLANVIGSFLAKTLHSIGLGCLDRLAGAVFGFFQGMLLVTIFILVTIAFFPKTRWLAEAKLPKLFFGACHLSTQISPVELAARVRDGLGVLERESPQWMHPGKSGN
jgi:membrane protein required for colicin V production